MAETCYPEVQNNEILKQDKIVKLLQKLESCSTREEIKDSINEILAEKEKEGIISIEDFKNRNLLISDSVAVLAECSLKEMIPDFETFEAQPSAIVNSVLNFICNPPTFPAPPQGITLSKPFGDVFKGILNYLLEAVIKLLSSLISDIMSTILDVCESGVDSFDTFDKNLSLKLLNTLTNSTNNLIATLQKIVNTFGFNMNGDLIQYELEEDVCTTPPATSARPFTELLDELPLIITPLEFCSLLEGSASKYTLDTIRQLIKFEYPVLAIRLSNNEIIKELFKEIGNLLDPSICRAIRSAESSISYDNYDDICDINTSRDNARLAILNERGHTIEQSTEILNREKLNISNKLSKVTSLLLKLKRDPDKVLEDISNINIFCNNNNEGLVKLADMPEIASFYKNSFDSCYNNIKSKFREETDEIPSIFISGKTKRTKIPRLINLQYTNATGRIQTIEDAINPNYLAQEQINKVYYTLNNDYATPDEITLDNFKVVGGTENEYLFDNKYLIINSDNSASDVEEATNEIEGIIKESIEANSFEVYNVNYDLNSDQTAITTNLDSSLEILNKENNFLEKQIKDYSLINLPSIVVQLVSEEVLKSINLGLFNNFSQTELTQEQLNQLVQSSKTLIYGPNSYSSGPFRPVSKEIQGYLTQEYNVPQLYNSIISPQEVSFRLLLNKSNISTSNYNEIFKNMILNYNNEINQIVNDDVYQKSFINAVQLVPINKMFGIVQEKEKVKKAYLNDPCAISQNTEEIELFNKTIIYSCIDLLIRSHVLKNNLKFIYYLPLIDLKEIVKNDDSYIEFLLQTFLQDLLKLSGKTAIFNDNFLIYLNKYFDELESTGNLADPITEEPLLDSEYSTDYKIRYFIKKQFMYLTKTMKVFNNIYPVDNIVLTNYSRLFSRVRKPESLQLLFYVKYDNNTYFENERVTAPELVWKYGVGIFYNQDTANPAVEIARYERVGNFKLQNDIFEFTDAVKQDLFNEFLKTKEYKVLFDFCFATSKIYSFHFINHILNTSKTIPKSNRMFNSTDVAIKDLFVSMLDSEIDPSCLTPDSLINDIDVNFDLDKIIARLTLETGIEIFKSLAERVDPNISVAKPISKLYNSTIGATTGVTLPVLPFSLGLLPFGTIPPPIGIGPPLTPTYGYTYLALDTLLYFLSISEKQQKFKFDISLQFEDENLDDFEESC